VVAPQASAGRGQVTVDWEPIDGAAGYLVHRSYDDGPAELVDHKGGDLLAVPGPPYADTTVHIGHPVRYAVRPVFDPDEPDAEPLGPLSEPAAAVGAAGPEPAGRVEITVAAGQEIGPVRRPWRDMVGSEHLSMLLERDEVGGEKMGDGLAAALTRVHTELGVGRVRAHGILGDDLGVYREVDGVPVLDFSGVDAVLDALAPTGLRPVLELSFMPRALARDPSTVVTAAGVSSPPKDWDQWAVLIGEFVRHLLRRVGEAELSRWAVEVWNEPDLGCFWTGTQEEYFRLYEVTARAVREACPGLAIGGPATAATHWVRPFLEHVNRTGAPLDFVSTHVYGSPPLDLRPILARHGWPGTPLLWTEWGPTPTHFAPVNDTALAGTFVATGMRSAAERVDALAHWVASDHFEELGRPPALLHGGFGLLSVGCLAKPRYWALWALEQLAGVEVAHTTSGDGAGSLVRAWPSIDPATGRFAVVIWNGTLDQSVLDRPDRRRELHRSVRLRIDGLRRRMYRLRHRRLDDTNSNLAATAGWLGVDGWPTPAQWQRLRAADRLADIDLPSTVDAVGGSVRLDLELPMPSLSLIEVEP
jgi:xylan 1,4-beta-xylosidase